MPWDSCLGDELLENEQIKIILCVIEFLLASERPCDGQRRKELPAQNPGEVALVLVIISNEVRAGDHIGQQMMHKHVCKAFCLSGLMKAG